MKKIFSALFFILVASSTCQAATPVRISDYNVNDFYYAYNNVALNIVKNNFTLNDLPMYVSTSDLYDTYITSCGGDGHGAIIAFFANRQGHVSKLTLTGKAESKINVEITFGALLNVLVTLGASDREVKFFIDQFLTGRREVYHYCSAIKRYIAVEILPEQDNLIYIRVTAFTN